MARSIHPSAVVEDGATLGEGVQVGPFCHVGGEVELAEGCVLHSHVAVAGRTAVGARTRIFPFASVGHQPQDLKYAGEPSTLEIGADNIIREHVTLNPGTKGGGMRTVVGDRNLFMMGAHVAHDCRVGDGCVLANNATLGGHVVLEDGAIVGGLAAVHQFVRVGAHAMIGGLSAVVQDVIPYGMVFGDRATLRGLNWIGMKRAGTDRKTLARLRKAFRQLFDGEGPMGERLDAVSAEHGADPMVRRIVEFMAAESDRGLCLPESSGDAA